MKIFFVVIILFLFSSLNSNLSAQEISIEDSLYNNLDSLYELKNDKTIESEDLGKEISIIYENALEYLFYFNDMTSTELVKFRSLFEKTEKTINLDEYSEEEVLSMIDEISYYDKYYRLPEFHERFIALKEKAGLNEE